MKKKIKDLTFKEMNKICFNHKGKCNHCPLNEICDKGFIKRTIKDLEREVEVNE